MTELTMVTMHTEPGLDRNPRSRRMLTETCLEDYLIRIGRSCPVTLGHTLTGQPFVVEGSPFLSTACCRSHWVCAVGNRPVGVDLERLRPIDVDNLARHVFAPREQDLCRNSHREFFNIWTKKEAYSKMTGQGLLMPFLSFDTTQPNALGVEFYELPCATEYKAVLCRATARDQSGRAGQSGTMFFHSLDNTSISLLLD